MKSDSQNNLINLTAFSGQDEVPPFLAIACKAENINTYIHCLTPEVMQWSDGIYLFDLRPCASYWAYQSKKNSSTLFDTYKHVLNSCFGETLTAVFSAHPWQSLFFLDYLSGNEMAGIYSLASPLGKKIYKNIEWKHWFSGMPDLARHLENVNTKRFRASEFRSRQQQLKRFIKRLDLQGPYDLEQAEVIAIQRRYAGWLGQVWKWTFMECHGNQAIDLERFPWISLQLDNHIRVQRDMEYPVSQWDVVEPLLRADFKKICQSGKYSRYDRVNTVYWLITLFNLEEVEIKISFRNPHALCREAPDFKTALYQAYYAYQDMMSHLVDRTRDLDLPAEMPFLSWKIEIKNRLSLPPLIVDMFASDLEGTDYDSIIDLQNRLPEALESYAIDTDFVPEQLFKPVPAGYKNKPEFSANQWARVVLQRPLFFLKKPELINDILYRRFFIERTSNNWWSGQSVDEVSRDYFILRDSKGRSLWVFRDRSGKWYRHGIFS